LHGFRLIKLAFGPNRPSEWPSELVWRLVWRERKRRSKGAKERILAGGSLVSVSRSETAESGK